MADKPPNALERLLSEYLTRSLLQRARRFRSTHPQMAVFAHDFIGTEINVYGRYEDRELGLLTRLIAGLDRSKLVLDVGANIGNHTLFFVAEGFERIHAFEPNPRTVRLLQINTERHPEVTVHAFGLSGQDATLEAVIPLTNAGGASLDNDRQHAHESESERMVFELKRFDELLLARETVGLVKIDVEGHEPQAVEGMIGMLRRDVPLVVCECNRKTQRASADRLVALLRQIGYDHFVAIEPKSSVIPQSFPTPFRAVFRLIERLICPSRSSCRINPIDDFEERNYPMIVASRGVLT